MWIPDFRKAHLLVVGDVMLDRYWYGPIGRISPEAPVPVVQIEGEESRPGGAANVALNGATLGAVVDLLGIIGEDPEAELLTKMLAAAGVHFHSERSAHSPTPHKLRILSRNQQLLRLDFERELGACEGTSLLGHFHSLLPKADAVVLSDYNKGTLNAVEDLVAAAREIGKPVLIDPKGGDFNRYRGATALTPNRTEFESVAGPCPDEETLANRAEELCHNLGLEALLVTRGQSGMTLVAAGTDPVQFSAQAREVFDVTGAGDTVIALLATARAAGADWETAAALANIGAGVVVTRPGTTTVTAAELRRCALLQGGSEPRILGEEEVLTAVEAVRACGETVVMTNGCFDLLHAGHVTYLEEARQLGDRLLVAVNDDESVAHLKGRERPVVPLEHRLTVLAGLSSVDWVVPFSGWDPAPLVERVQPDVLVKGGDYEPSEIAGFASVTQAGGRVVTLPYHEGYSSSQIVRTLRGEDPI